MDFLSREPIKVISGVVQEIKAENITEDIDGVVGACRLCMLDGEKKFTSSMLLFFNEESLPVTTSTEGGSSPCSGGARRSSSPAY